MICAYCNDKIDFMFREKSGRSCCLFCIDSSRELTICSKFSHYFSHRVPIQNLQQFLKDFFCFFLQKKLWKLLEIGKEERLVLQNFINFKDSEDINKTILAKMKEKEKNIFLENDYMIEICICEYYLDEMNL